MNDDYGFSMWAAFWWGGTFPLYISAFAVLLTILFFVLLFKPSRRYTVLYCALAFMPFIAGMVSAYSMGALHFHEITTTYPQLYGIDIMAYAGVPFALIYGGGLVTFCAMIGGAFLLARSFLREDVSSVCGVGAGS